MSQMMGESYYTRGTADESYGASARKKKSPIQQFFDEAAASFQRGYGPAIKFATETLPQRVSEVAPFFGGTSLQAEVGALGVTTEAQAAGLPEKTVEQVGAAAREQLRQSQLEANAGLGLGPVGVALGGVEQAWSYGVARPASTAALLADPTSKLYKDGTVNLTNQFGETEVVPVEKGFQVGDIGLAWNRSEEVSFGRSAFALPGYKQFYSMVGGIENYDPWSNYSLDQAGDNAFYNFITGSTDASLEVFVPPAARVARLSAMEKAGLRTTIKSAKDVENLRSEAEAHRLYVETDGVEGSVTTIGMAIDDAAIETNPVKVRQMPIVANANGMDKQKFANILASTTDRGTVEALVLASRGDYRSMLDLMDRAPDHVWALSNADELAFNNWLDTGRTLDPTNNRVNQMFDSAVARDEYFSEVKRAFTTDEGLLKVGSTWMPTKRIFVEKIRGAKGKTQYAIRQADYNDAPRFVQTIASSKLGGPTTIFLQYLGSRRPLGRVTRSGARPDDIWDELTAQLDSIPALRGVREVIIGQRVVDGETIPIRITAPEYRQQLAQRMYEASNNNNLEAAWREMEDELTIVMADTLDVPRDQALRFIAGYRQRANEQLSYLQKGEGFLYDEQASKIVLDVATRRQFLDSFMAMPMDEIYHGLRDIVSPAARLYNKTTGFGTDAFDAGMKFFRTNVLFRPGYTGKNAILEPLLASFLAHGTILTDEGIFSTLGNFVSNRIANTKAGIYALELDTLFDKWIKQQPKQTRKQLRADLAALINQRHATQRARDLAFADLQAIKSGVVRPALREEIDAAARQTLIQAQLDLEKIEAMLDGYTTEWRQIVEPDSLVNISTKLDGYEQIVNAGEDGLEQILISKGAGPQLYIAQRHPNMNDYRDGGSGGIGESRTVVGPVKTSFLKDAPGNATVRERVEYQKERLRSGEGFQDPIQVYVDPKTGKFFVGEGNHRLRAALELGEEYVPVRVYTRRKIDDDFISQPGGKVGTVEVPTSPWRGGLGEEYWPPEIHPSFIFGDNAPFVDISNVSKLDFNEFSNLVNQLRENYDNVVRATERSIDVPYTELNNLDDQLKVIDSKIGATQRELGAAREKYAAVTGLQGFRGSGSGYMTLRVGGEEFKVPAAFADVEFNFGSGYRAEASEALTSRMTYDPSYQANYMTGRIIRNGQPTETLPTADNYWDELSHVANFQLRDDLLVQRILRGDSRADIAKWLSTAEGRAYQKSMGRNYLLQKETYSDPVSPLPVVDPTNAPVKGRIRSALDRINQPAPQKRRRVLLESTTELDEMIRIVNQYFPDPKVRSLIASREVTAGELQRMMGDRDDLSRILGEDLTYLPNSNIAQTWDKVNSALDRIWQFIATMPSDRVTRWPFYQREFRRQMELRAEILTGQGIKLTPKQAAALRQSSHRAALIELEKTFYNIRRYNTPVYTARFLMSFPGAFFNSIYRYGRFAAREPERMFQVGLFANDLLLNMGVDEYGNRVENPAEATYLLIPGTKRSELDTGLRIPVSSFATMTVDYPSLSWGANMAVAQLVKQKPETEDIIRKALGPAFDEMFPYGFARNPVSGLFGSYQKDFWRGFRGPSDADWIQTTTQIYADNMAQWEMNGMPEGQQPTFEDAASQAGAFYYTRGTTKFFNALSTDRKVPGQLMRDAWYDIRQKFPEDSQAAREEFTKKYGEAARWYTYSTSEYVTYIPSSQDAYRRIWVEYPELAKGLKSIVGNDNAEYIALLAMGTDGTFSQSVSNYMRDNPLPGDDVPVITRMQPTQFANVVAAADGWALYSGERVKYDAEINRLRALRDDAETEYNKDRYRAQIKATQDSWNLWVNVEGPLATNEAWQFDRADSEQRAPRAALILKKIISDKKFSRETGNTPLWKSVSYFLENRDKALEAVKAESDTKRKAVLKESFATWVEDNILAETPEFYPTWERYFIGEWVKENE